MKNIKKKDIIITSIVGVCGVSIGIVAGSFIGKGYYASKNAIDYNAMSINDFEDDAQALMKRYNSSKNKSYDTEFKPYELATIALEKVKNHAYVKTQSFGVVNAMGIKQTIRATSIKNNNSYFLENLSVSSMVQVAKRFYQTDDQVTTYDSNKAETEKAVWNTDPISTLPKAEHEEIWGKDLSRPSIYIISSKTALSTSYVEKTTTGYTVSLDLHPVYSVLRYVKQMIVLSGVESPKFESINLKYTLDNDLNLIKSTVSEKYSVVMVVQAQSDASLEEFFTYDMPSDIPDLNTNVNYSKGE